MSNWSGNTYRRDKELPEFLKQIDQEELQKWGNKKDRQFMTNYGYASKDGDIAAKRNSTRVIRPKSLN